MSSTCEICGKTKHVGGSVTRRGMAKKKGGIGMHVVKNAKRVFYPNVQSVRTRDAKGTVKKLKVCAACLRTGKVQKA